MLLNPAVVLIGALYAAFLLLRHLAQLHHHRKLAKELHCQPPASGNPGFLGIPAFLRLTKAVREKRWIDYLCDQFDINGTTFTQIFLTRKIITTIEPENVKAVLATQFQDFCLGTRHEQFYPLLGDGIFTLDGAGWSHARGLLRPQFTRDQVADLSMLDDHISHLINLIPKDRSSFDIQRLFFLLTLDSATHFLFGESVGCMSPTTTGVLAKSAVRNAQGFADAFTTAQDYLAARSRAQSLYWVVNPKEFREANSRVHEVVDHYVNLALEAKRNPDRKQADGRYIFLEALAAETDNPKTLRDNMLNILLAGRDTTASLLSSTFFYLARYPDVFARLRKEIVDAFGDSKTTPRVEITQTKLKDIPYLRYVLNEVLRLQPPVPVNFRVATKDTSLPVGGGPDRRSPVYVKKGTMIAYNVFAMHRRTDLWGPDARTFRPERWEENAKHGWEYLPFNGGPRICLGQQYALTEASYTVVRLLQHFDYLESADPDPRLEPIKQSNLTMMHDHGVPVKLYASK
jgi:cytochrome P450